MKTIGAIFFRARTHFYDVIPMTDDEHPVDLAVQRWTQHGTAQRRILNLQEQLLGLLAPDAQRTFLELEELRNEIASEKEEAYFDAGVGYGIERQRQRQQGRLQKLSPTAARVAARVRRSIEREGFQQHEAVLVLVEVLTEYATSLAGVPRESRKGTLRGGPLRRAT